METTNNVENISTEQLNKPLSQRTITLAPVSQNEEMPLRTESSRTASSRIASRTALPCMTPKTTFRFMVTPGKFGVKSPVLKITVPYSDHLALFHNDDMCFLLSNVNIREVVFSTFYASNDKGNLGHISETFNTIKNMYDGFYPQNVKKCANGSSMDIYIRLALPNYIYYKKFIIDIVMNEQFDEIKRLTKCTPTVELEFTELLCEDVQQPKIKTLTDIARFFPVICYDTFNYKESTNEYVLSNIHASPFIIVKATRDSIKNLTIKDKDNNVLYSCSGNKASFYNWMEAQHSRCLDWKDRRIANMEQEQKTFIDDYYILPLTQKPFDLPIVEQTGTKFLSDHVGIHTMAGTKLVIDSTPFIKLEVCYVNYNILMDLPDMDTYVLRFS